MKFNRNNRGSILVLAVVSLIMLFGIASIAVDLAQAYTLVTQMQNAADVAALAGIKKLAQHTGEIAPQEIREATRVTAEQNFLYGRGTTFLNDAPNGDIQLGHYNLERRQQGLPVVFEPIEDNQVNRPNVIVNAIRVNVRLANDAGTNRPFVFSLGRIFETVHAMNLQRQAIATFGLVNVLVVFDISGSMQNQTYLPVSSCIDHSVDRDGNSYETNNDRYFLNAARANESRPVDQGNGQMLSCIGPPTAVPEIDGQSVVMPQPLTDVSYAISDVLFGENDIFRNYYRAGLIFYESTAYSPDASLQIEARKINNKEEISDYLENTMIKKWAQYAQGLSDIDLYLNPGKEALLASVSANFPWPGGLDAPRTGYTNIGDGIKLALQQIGEVNRLTGAFATNLVVLFTDGEPTCAGPTDCGTSLADRIRAKNYALNAADDAAAHDVVIHGVYFGPGQNCSNPQSLPAGFLTIQEIANRTQGEAFCASRISCSDADCLSEVFSEELSQRPSFFLVPHD